MASNAQRKYYTRDFLNEGRGFAAYELDMEIWHPTLTSVTFKISDCTRQISLDFSYDGQEAKDKIMAKLDKLIGALQNTKEQLLAN